MLRLAPAAEVHVRLDCMTIRSAIIAQALAQTIFFVILPALTLFGSADRFDVLEFWLYVPRSSQFPVRLGGQRVGLIFLLCLVALGDRGPFERLSPQSCGIALGSWLSAANVPIAKVRLVSRTYHRGGAP